MSLSYDKIKKKRGDDSFWASYSDLATVLSILFLMLYVVATMRASTVAIIERGNLKDAQQEISALKEQLQSYEVLKEDYLKNTHQAEQKMYSELLDHMKLIEDDTKIEKERLSLQAKEAAEKEESLNRYQKIIKNIIQANIMVQKEIKTRDEVIREKTLDIAQLKGAIQERESRIQENKKKIADIQNNLKGSIARLKKMKEVTARTKQEAKQQIAQLEAESLKQVEMLRKENRSTEVELAKTREVMVQKSRELQTTQTQLDKLEKEKSKVQAELRKERESFQSSMAELSGKHEARLAEERARYEEGVKREKLSAQEQLQREKAYQAKVEAEKGRYAEDLKKLESNLEVAKIAAKKKEAELESAKEQFEEGIEKERLTAEQKIEREREFRAKLEAEKAESTKKLSGLAQELDGTRAEMSRKDREYRAELEQQKATFEKGMGELRAEYEGNLARERAAFEAGLKKERLSGAEKMARQKAYAEKLAREKDEYNSKMQKLSGQLGDTRRAIADQDAQYKKSLGQLSSANQGMQRELAALREREEQRRALAKKIEENFKRSGIDANINAKTGEVTINFGEEYFETGKASMKDGMRKILEKAMPAYAKSILEDQKLAEKVASVEIVGFASPTYKGSYVNPKDLSGSARKAVDYNMDLSYQRAKSIFDHVFNPRKFSYAHQNELLPLAKVTGQGYLRSEGVKETKEMSGEEYCAKYDCTKAQKVVIKFHFKD